MIYLFWTCLGIVFYTYAGYPILLALVGMIKRDRRRVAPFSGTFSFVLCVHNEQDNLRRRVEELKRLGEHTGCRGEIILVSDASTDATAEVARELETHGIIRFLDRAAKTGKAAALSAGVALATGDILVFADARQRWEEDAVTRLLENFADPAVGAVSGELMLETAPGVLAGVGLYWRYEKWLRKRESRIHAQVGVTGAISACRRELFHPIPQGTLCDDVYWPLCVAMQGRRVIHDERARAFDRLPEKPRDEFRRKVRTLAGNFQMLRLLPASLLPWRNPVWFQWISHKLLRLVVPWALIGLLVGNLWLVAANPPTFWQAHAVPDFWRDVVYPGCLGLQALGYGIGLAGLSKQVATRFKPAGAAASLLVLNAAAFLAFWVWITGRAAQSWRKISYDAPAAT